MNGGGVPFDRVKDFFAPAQFLELNDDEKLSAPSFEPMVAGISIGRPDSPQFTGQRSTTSSKTTPSCYETILIDGEAPPAAPPAPISPTSSSIGISRSGRRPRARSATQRRARSTAACPAQERARSRRGWTIASRDDGSAQAAPGRCRRDAIVSYLRRLPGTDDAPPDEPAAGPIADAGAHDVIAS